LFLNSRKGTVNMPGPSRVGKPAHDRSDPDIVSLIPALRAFARTFCRDSTNADDLVQETLTKAIAAIDRFEPGTNMKSWLFTIMRNTFYTRIKANSREAPGLLDCVSGMPITPAPQEWSIRARELHQAIQRLPDQQRDVLILIGVMGISYEDTASICGCAMGTVKSRLNRARQKILEDLGEGSPQSLVETSLQLGLGAGSAASERQR